MAMQIMDLVSDIFQAIQEFWQTYAVGDRFVNGVQAVDGIAQRVIPPVYLRAGIGVVLALVVARTLFKGRKSSEQTVFKAHPCVIRNHPFLSVVGMLGCALGLLGFESNAVPFYMAGILGGVIMLALWVQSLRKTLSVTNERIMLRIGIVARDIREIYHADVRWVHLKQGVLGRLFGVGAIEVASAGTSDVEIAIAGIPNPAKAKRIIDLKRREEKEEQRMPMTEGSVVTISQKQ